MVKTIALISTVVISMASYGQKFKFDISGGYSNGFLTTAGYSYSEEYSVTAPSVESYSFEKLAYASGWVGRLGLTYMINDQLFINCAGRYQHSGEKELLLEYGNIDYTGGYAENYTSRLFTSMSNLEVQLGLGIQRKLSEKFSINMSAGPSIGVLGKLTYRELSDYTITSPIAGESEYETDEYIEEFRPSFQLGAYADLGVNFNLTERLELFANATLRIKTWSDKTSKVVSDKSNGDEHIDSYDTYQLETEYESSVNNVPPFDPNKPSVRLKQWKPASSIEYVIGIRYGIGAAPKVAAEASGRKGLYFSLLGGYSIPMGAGTSENVNYQSYSTKSMSFGSGMNFGLMAGYSLSNGLAFELGGMYSQSKNERFSTYFAGQNNNYTDVASMTRVQAGLKLEGDGKVVNPFIRAGVAANVHAKLTSARESEFSSSEVEYSKKISFGAYGGIGLSVRIAKSISIIGEGLFTIQNWSPEKSTRTKSVYNGNDELADATTYQLETVYVNEINYSNADPAPDLNSPSESVKFSLPFSALTFRLGIRFDLRR